jgi:putative flippase GtrA
MSIKELYKNNRSTIIQFGKFMLVGCLNFLVDFGVFMLLNKVFGVYSVYANIVSYSCGVINSYFFNRMWTFKRKLKYLSWDFAKFLFVNLISLGVSTLAVYIFVERFLMAAWIGKILSTFFSFTVNFAGNKLLVFKDKK